jgi:HD superfamily phosphodiesterase
MESVFLTVADIVQMTMRAGEAWAVAHAQRLLVLVKCIGVGIPYDFQVLELAAYLHDWGAFSCYSQKALDHALRSRQVVEAEILPHLDLTSLQETLLLESIELHDYRDTRPARSNEALLLREADMLEFLGAIGAAREFARGPNNVEISYERIIARRNAISRRFSLPAAREIAHIRIERLDRFLKELKEESLGVL